MHDYTKTPSDDDADFSHVILPPQLKAKDQPLLANFCKHVSGHVALVTGAGRGIG